MAHWWLRSPRPATLRSLPPLGTTITAEPWRCTLQSMRHGTAARTHTQNPSDPRACKPAGLCHSNALRRVKRRLAEGAATATASAYRALTDSCTLCTKQRASRASFVVGRLRSVRYAHRPLDSRRTSAVIPGALPRPDGHLLPPPHAPAALCRLPTGRAARSSPRRPLSVAKPAQAGSTR